MNEISFTDKGIAALKPPAEGLDEYRDPALPGFGVRVSARGTKTFFLARRVLRAGKRVKSRVSLGRYPAIKLAAARAEARRLGVEIDGAADPIAEQAAALAAIIAARDNTFAKAVEVFMKEHVANLRPGTALQYKYALQGADTAPWRDRPITSITKADIRALLAGMKERDVTIGANRTLAYLKKFFNWCAEEKDLIEVPPTLTVNKPHKEDPRARVLADAELVEVWTGTAALALRPRLALRALLLTAQRRGEVAGMSWQELEGLGTDEPVWCLPAARTKNKRPHRVPLSPGMVELIEAAREQATGAHVFGAGDKPLWLGGKLKQQIDTAIAANRLAAGVAESMPHWTFHDLRRTAATRMHETLNIEPHIVEAVLNHSSGHKGGVAGVYNHAEYSVQKRDALNRWSQRVDLLIRRAAGENVVELTTGGRPPR